MLGCFSNLLEKVLLSLIFAVNSICLWTCLLFFILAIISDCGCKSRTSFLICQTFWNFFLKKFSLRLNQYFKWTSLCLRVAKVEPLFKSRKLFLKFFFRFISKPFFKNHCSIFLRTSLVMRAAKIVALFFTIQIFFNFFQKSFWLGLLQNVVRTSASLRVQK